MNRITNQFASIEQVTDQYFSKKSVNRSEQQSDISFEQILREKAEEATPLRFSKHASLRLQDRNIQLSPSQNARLESGVTKAREKGIKESLVMVDSLAFIVNIPNKTVVTAIEQGESAEQIFTNIDGAVIV